VVKSFIALIYARKFYSLYRSGVKTFSGTNETPFYVGVFLEPSNWLLRNKQPIEIGAQMSASNKPIGRLQN